MRGHVSSDVALDFADAARAGERTGTSLEASVVIAADDLERLIADPTHAARLQGTVTVPALASEPLAIDDGLFNLMASDPARPAERKTRYRGRLGPAFAFEGFKVFIDDPGFDSWSDATTVYVSVRRAADGVDLVRGIATMSPQDVARSVRSLEVTNARSTSERLEAAARFGRFCLGPVFELYGEGKLS